MPTMTDVDLLTEAFFSLEPPCEYSEHENIGSTGSAKYVVRSVCPNCSDADTLLMCSQCYETSKLCSIECDCGYIGDSFEFWKVVNVVG